ncbi:MAG: glycosyltransferase family 4 protein [Candidatus Stahlbacteria bacterium]|nr:glycosyltransferase family 4 protein [Candidatus Stahlbacteria bacterium]
MRVGIDIRELERGKITGIGRYLLSLLEYIESFGLHNEYILFANQNTEYMPKSDNRRHSHRRGRASGMFHMRIKIIPEQVRIIWDQIKLPIALNREKVDIFLSPYFKAPLFGVKKKIIVINDLIPLYTSSFLHKAYFYLLCRLNAKQSDAVIAISKYTKAEIIKYFKINPHKIKVAYLGVKLLPEHREKTDVLLKYNIKNKYILAVSSFKPHKNLIGLIRAYNLLPGDVRANYELVIVARKNRYFYHKVNKLELDEKIRFIERVPEDELLCLYKEAVVLVIPSLIEGFGYPALESFASGTPVIASNIGALTEVIGEAGMLVDTANPKALAQAILKVITSTHLREELIALGTARVNKFDHMELGKVFLGLLRGAPQ